MSGKGTRTSYPVAVVAFALVLVVSGCDIKDNLTGPQDLGNLEVTTVSRGANIDPDGYQLLVTSSGSDDRTRGIGTNETVTFFNITFGTSVFTVTLNNIAANCSVDANPQVVTVPGGGTGTVTFNITCS